MKDLYSDKEIEASLNKTQSISITEVKLDISTLRSYLGRRNKKLVIIFYYADSETLKEAHPEDKFLKDFIAKINEIGQIEAAALKLGVGSMTATARVRAKNLVLRRRYKIQPI